MNQSTKAIIWLNTALLALLPVLALMTIVAITNFENGDPPEIWGTAALAMPDEPVSTPEDAAVLPQDDEIAAVESNYTTEAAIFALHPAMSESRLFSLASMINENAEANHLDPLLVVAVIEGESGFNSEARNKRSGCAGLMQLHPCHGVENVYDEETNIVFGCKLLKGYIDSRGGSIRRGLYRWGLDRKQARSVISRYEKLKEIVVNQPYLIEIECQFCDQKFRARNLAGQEGWCPSCGRFFLVDTAQSDESGFVCVWDEAASNN